MSVLHEWRFPRLLLAWSWLGYHIASATRLHCGQYWIKVGGWFQKKRHGLVYVPPSICLNGKTPSGLVLAFHCFGCTADLEINKWKASADALNLVFIAPEGTGRGMAFNGLECCGDAEAQGVDDIEVALQLAAVMLNTLAYIPNANHTLTMDSLLMVGSSNGGFLTSWAASRPSNWNPAGIIAAAGHISSLPPPLPGKPTTVWIQQGVEDTNFLPSGCCPAHPCCCGIMSSGECRGTEDHFEWWLTRNGCKGTTAMNFSDAPYARCTTGLECAAETRMCMFDGWDHAKFLGHAPLAVETLAVLLGQGDESGTTLGIQPGTLEEKDYISDAELKKIMKTMEQTTDEGQMKPVPLLAVAVLLLVGLCSVLVVWRHRSFGRDYRSVQGRRLQDEKVYSFVETTTVA